MTEFKPLNASIGLNFSKKISQNLNPLLLLRFYCDVQICKLAQRAFSSVDETLRASDDIKAATHVLSLFLRVGKASYPTSSPRSCSVILNFEKWC